MLQRKDTGKAWAVSYSFAPIRKQGDAIVGAIVIGRDITERKQAEESLRQLNQELEAKVEERSREAIDLYNHAPCGYHSVDATGTIIAVNETELVLLGYSREEYLGHYIGDFMTPECREIFGSRFFTEFHPTGRARDVEAEYIRGDGTVLPVLLSADMIRDAEGRFLSTRSTLVDNRERKARERQIAVMQGELARRADEAETATRVKSAFLANMSHEIRTPMNAVLGFCYLLEQRPLDSDTRYLVSQVHNAGRSLLTLINDILDFSKIEAGRLEIEAVPFSLNTLMDDLASIMTATANDKQLELVITPPLVTDGLIGDGLRLRQVLVNLLGNAIKFTEQGEVELRIAVESQDEQQVDLRFLVSDTGIGISREQQADIFSAFSQADGSISRRFGGTGLGLAISQQLVGLMGGTLRVDSVVGQGSEFWFVLPLRRDPNVERTPSPLSRLELLLVDDNDTARAALAASASCLGWKADVADSGEAALMQTLARANGEGFYDALLLDWKMPGLDGLAAAKAIRQALEQTKILTKPAPIIIMVTAHSREDLLALPGIAWVDRVLSKPVTPSNLYNAVAGALNQRQSGLLTMQATPNTAHTQRIPGVRVLVVDDSDINREVAQRILENDGASVHLAEDGQQAVEWLQANPAAVDIVLMDVQMPRLDGYAATRLIREDARWKNLPIVALTAGAFQTLRDTAADSGMNDFLAKPFNVEQMMALIQRWTGCRPEANAVELSGHTGMDCRYPVDRNVAPPIIPSVWVPAIPAGTTGKNLNSTTLEPEAVPAVPDLPGVDLARGLKLFGKAPSYRNYLNKFVATYACAGVSSANFCRQGDFAAVAMLIHKLTGVAGTLALPRVYDLARLLDAQLATGAPGLEAIACDLQTAIDEVCGAVPLWTLDDSSVAAVIPTDASANREELAELLNQLRQALDQGDPKNAESLLTQLQGRVDAARLAEILERVSDFDFQAADALTLSLLDGDGD